MTLAGALRSLQSLVLRQHGCQQSPSTAISACGALHTQLADALAAGLAHPAGSTSTRALTTVSSGKACGAGPGCGCRACAARRRQPRGDPGPPATEECAAFDLHHGSSAEPSGQRLPAEVAGAEALRLTSTRMGSSAGQSGRRFSTAAAASSSPCAQARLRALRYGRGLAWAESGVAGPHIRAYSTVEEHQAEIDAINDKFAEARDEIDYANEDAESTYFDESYKAAETVTNEVLERYRALCDKLSDAERGKLQRSMGMKMEQLKAEFKLLDTLHD